MSNPYYTKTGQPASQTQGRSDVIRAEYSLIEAGFDAAYAAILLRATSASPTFTGTVNASGATTVTVPTEANVADSTTKAASTAFVQSVLGAAGALLPVQTTYSSLYSLKTNGTVASWQLTLPSQASASGKYLKSNGTSDSWELLTMARQAATGTLAVGLADNHTMIDCSGTFTVTFAAPATLTAGWNAILRNTGSGNITVAHTSGNIDGLTSYVMYPGEARLFQCDASTIRSQVIQGFRVFVTSSTTATMPPGYLRLGFDLQGGGAGGGGGASGTHAGNTQAVNGGCGGGGGGRHVGDIDPPAAGTTITVSVGTGGAAVSGRAAGASLVSVSGNPGGNSSISWSSVTRAEAQGATVPSSANSYGGEYAISAFGGRYTGGSQTSQNATNTDGGSSYMAAGAGGSGGGVLYNSGGPAYNFQPASAGGTKNTGTAGGGGAAGTSGATGGAGSTASDSGGGGGGYGNLGAGGNGAAGTGYGSGGGGGGACTDGSAAGGNGGAGVDGFACIMGIV